MVHDGRALRSRRTEGSGVMSVLIATHNRAAVFENCLLHLERQQFEPGDDVIVVPARPWEMAG